MGLFIVVAEEAPDRTHRAIERAYPDRFFRLNDSTWIVAVRGETSRQVSTRIGFNGEGGLGAGVTGAGAVFAFDAYWGHYNRNLWEWIRVKTEESNG